MSSLVSGVDVTPRLAALSMTNAGSREVIGGIPPRRGVVRLAIELIDILLIVRGILRIPREIVGSSVEEDRIVDVVPSFRVAARRCAFPDNLVLIVLRTEHRVHDDFEVMGGGGVAVEIDGAGGFEDAAEFEEAEGHHGEVGEHVGGAEEVVEAFEAFGEAVVAGAEGFGVFGGGFEVPRPGVFEGFDLGVGL